MALPSKPFMRGLLRFTLDLFDAVAAPSPAKFEPPAPAPALPPTQPTASLLAPAQFSHPQANRQALLGGAVVAYYLRRGKRRSIGFSIGADGLVVSAPKWVPLVQIDAALQEKSAWVVRKLDESHERQRRLVANHIEWREGALVPFLGEPVRLVLDPRQSCGAVGAQLLDEGLDAAGAPRRSLQVGLPQTAQPEQIRDATQAWLMRQSQHIFTERLHHFAPQLGVQWKKLRLSSAGTRWGSASADGSIRLNWRLVHFRMPIIDYVVAHELAHLRVMDHSPRFWETVESVMPDYAQRRRVLKTEPVPSW